jgi:serine/threonine protein kinase
LDIKSANIFKKGSRYYLGDFGLAVHTENGHASANKIEEGDGRYMARELLDWIAPSDLTKCDIFSLGITVYEIVAGQEMVPLNGPLFHELRSGKLPAPPHGISLELTTILQDMMAPDPLNRPSAQRCLDHYLSLKSDVEKELFFQKLRVETLMHELETVTDNSNK